MGSNWSGLFSGGSPTLAWTQKRSKGYYKNEEKNLLEAWAAAQASPEERAMMLQQIASYEQSVKDRKSTRNMILAKMGFKLGKDQNGKQTIVPLTKEERIAAMTQAQKSRSSAAEAYTERANAALTGKTKLPSFLKSNIDYEKETEKAALAEMLGGDFEKSTAAQQVVSEMMKKEEDIRQQLQDQDIAVTPGMAQGLRGMLADEANQKISQYEYLPRQSENLMRGRASLLGDLQQKRLGNYKYRLGQLESDRAEKQSYINAVASIFGASGGMAAAKDWKKKPTAEPTGTSAYGPYSTGYSYPQTSSGIRMLGNYDANDPSTWLSV